MTDAVRTNGAFDVGGEGEEEGGLEDAPKIAEVNGWRAPAPAGLLAVDDAAEGGRAAVNTTS